MPKRIEPLEVILDEIKPHIVILTEHDMKSFEIDRLNIKNFKLSSNFCRNNTKKGGVLILSRENLEWTQVTIPNIENISEEKQFEFCANKYHIGNTKFIVIGVYRSPRSNIDIFLDRLSILIEIVLKKSKNIIIAGDININVLNNNNSHHKLKNILKSFNMDYLVRFPTRVFQGSVSAIDNFLTTFTNDQIRVFGAITLLSDHDGQVLEIIDNNNSKQNNYITETKRDFSKENIELSRKLLGEESWQDVFISQIDKKFITFQRILTYYFNLAFPPKSFKIKPSNNKWINSSLKDEKKGDHTTN